VALGDLHQHRVLRDAALRHGAVGGQQPVVLLCLAQQLVLRPVGVALDLVAEDLGVFAGLVDLLGGEVAEAEVADQALVLQLAQCAEGRADGTESSGQCSSIKSTKPVPSRSTLSRVDDSTAGRRKWSACTLLTTKTSSRGTPDARRPSPTSASLPYTCAVSRWR